MMIEIIPKDFFICIIWCGNALFWFFLWSVLLERNSRMIEDRLLDKKRVWVAIWGLLQSAVAVFKVF